MGSSERKDLMYLKINTLKGAGTCSERGDGQARRPGIGERHPRATPRQARPAAACASDRSKEGRGASGRQRWPLDEPTLFGPSRSSSPSSLPSYFTLEWRVTIG